MHCGKCICIISMIFVSQLCLKPCFLCMCIVTTIVNALSCCSSIFWLVYGLLSVNSMLIRINSFSLVLFTIYIAIYYAYCHTAVRCVVLLRYGVLSRARLARIFLVSLPACTSSVAAAVTAVVLFLLLPLLLSCFCCYHCCSCSCCVLFAALPVPTVLAAGQQK